MYIKSLPSPQGMILEMSFKLYNCVHVWKGGVALFPSCTQLYSYIAMAPKSCPFTNGMHSDFGQDFQGYIRDQEYNLFNRYLAP